MSFSNSIISKVIDRLFKALYRSLIFIRSLNTRIASRENWKPAQTERLDGVGGEDRKKKKIRSPPGPLFPRAALGFSFETANSLVFESCRVFVIDEFHYVPMDPNPLANALLLFCNLEKQIQEPRSELNLIGVINLAN